VTALSNPSILNQMLAFADAQWCSEGLLFWIDVQGWRSRISPLHSLQRSATSSPATSPLPQSRRLSTSSPGGLAFDDTKEKETKVLLAESQSSTHLPSLGSGEVMPIESSQLEALRDFARSVYLTYFVRGADGSAPLELNIPDEIRSKVVTDLCIRKENNVITCQFEYKSDLISLFDAAEKECLRLLYDNVFLPFCAKVNMQDIIASQERLRNLYSGDALPFNTVTESASSGEHLAASVVIPSTSKGIGGVSTKRSRYDQEESYSEEISMSRPKQPSEILHVGIDAASSLKLIFKENTPGTSVTNTPSLTARNYEGPPLSPIGELELISPVSEEA
jgi:hypothetical protein